VCVYYYPAGHANLPVGNQIYGSLEQEFFALLVSFGDTVIKVSLNKNAPTPLPKFSDR
jgi:hypothetical protein